VTRWSRWPWPDSGAADEAPGPAADDRYELTPAALHALYLARTDRAMAVIEEALKRYGNGPFPGDVLLDVKLALRPAEQRPHVPVVPGPPDGAGRG
jgi:hypothetical protein